MPASACTFIRRLAHLLAPALLLAALGCRGDAGSPTEPETAAPQADVVAKAALAFRQVSGGGTHTCGVTTDDKAYCWGDGQLGQLGNGTPYGPELCGYEGIYGCSSRPVAVLGGLRFRMVSAGAYYTCGVTTDDRAYCWGGNSGGQLGDGTTTTRLTPVAVRGGHLFRQLSAGGSNTCGVTTDNRALCWGSNSSGQVGDGTQQQRLVPVVVAGARRFRQVSAGTTHTCGLTTENRALCWGDNTEGQIGDSTQVARRLEPVRVAGGRYYRQLNAGDFHTCAVTTGFRAFCWGSGKFGQLGNGRTSLALWPRAVAGGLSFKRVTGGRFFTCGETTGNRAYCWGENDDGEVGNGTLTGPETCEYQPCWTRPVAVVGGLYFSQVDAGGHHACARTAANVAYCWGDKFYGQLGDGTRYGSGRPRPTPVLGPL